MNVFIVGCGLTGAVVARECAQAGHSVQMVEKRAHTAGNLYDFVEEHGFLVHKYGPHTFHTGDPALAAYFRRYAGWQPFSLRCGAVIDGQFSPTPFNFRTVDTFYPASLAESLKQKLAAAFPGRETAPVAEVLQHADADIRAYAEFLFEKDYAPYTAKQWGITPAEIDPSVLARVPLRFSYRDGYYDDAFQGLPGASYQALFERLLDHPNISVTLQTDALAALTVDPQSGGVAWRGKAITGPVVYTGPLDELFSCQFGRLPYRSLRFEWHYEAVESKQPAPVVAYPQEPGFTRITEYKKLPPQQGKGTVYAVETPLAYDGQGGNEPYYPVLTQESLRLKETYAALAARIPNLFCCGRLGDFRYYNMDQALSRALETARAILEKSGGR